MEHALRVINPEDAVVRHPRWQITDIDRSIARALRAIRTNLGVHPDLLDCAIGASQGTIRRYEAGVRPIGAAHLYRISQLLNIPIAEFFSEDAWLSAAAYDSYKTVETSDVADPTNLPAPPTPAEVQRFLSLFQELEDEEVKRTVRDLLRTLSEIDETEPPENVGK
jgi:transcriptional regulator with XRE-family HTH domain